MQRRQNLMARELPSGEREVEGSDLRAALVEFQSVYIVAQGGVDRRGGAEVFLFHPKPREQRQGEDCEMPGAHAGIEERYLFSTLRPACERAGGRRPSLGLLVLREAEIGPLDLQSVA